MQRFAKQARTVAVGTLADKYPDPPESDAVLAGVFEIFADQLPKPWEKN